MPKPMKPNKLTKGKVKKEKRLTEYEMITSPLPFISSDGTLEMAMAIIHLVYGIELDASFYQ